MQYVHEYEPKGASLGIGCLGMMYSLLAAFETSAQLETNC
jgi:hypothetical protein